MNTYFFFQSVWMAIIAIGACFVHIIFALAVLSDAVTIQDRGQKMVFVSGKMWALAVLFGGVFVVAVYWAIHHSTLCPRPSSKSDPLE